MQSMSNEYNRCGHKMEKSVAVNATTTNLNKSPVNRSSISTAISQSSKYTMGKENNNRSQSSLGWSYNRIILFLMGAAVGIGIGFGIGHYSKNVGALHNIDIASIQYGVHNSRRKTIANIDPSKLLRGKDFTLPPTENVVEIRPLPTPKPSSSPQPTRKHSSKSSKNPTIGPTSVDVEDVATRHPTRKPTLSVKDTTSDPSTVPRTSAPTESIEEIRPSPSPKPSSSNLPTTRKSAKNHKIPTSGPTLSVEDIGTGSPSSKQTLIPTNKPTSSNTTSPSMKPTSFASTNTPSHSTTQHPTAIDQATTHPSSSSTSSKPTPASESGTSGSGFVTDSPTMKCTCMPTIVDGGSTASPTLGKQQATLSPTMATMTALLSSIPSSDNTCHPLEEETCCNQLSQVPNVDKDRVCQKLGCNFNNCVTSSPSFNPTTTSTDSPTFMPSTVGPTTSPTKQPSKSPSGEPTLSPFHSPSVGPTLSPSERPISSSPTGSPSGNPSPSPTHEPSRSTSVPSINPSSEPPYYTDLPTTLPTTKKPTRGDSLIPTTVDYASYEPTGGLASNAPVILFVSSSPTIEPTFQATFGSTPTVSKETTAPPTLKQRHTEKKPSTAQDASIKELGSNDYKPHFVYTSKVETECTQEEGNDYVAGMQQTQICVLHCIETTRLYEGNFLLSETANHFKNECPPDMDVIDDLSSVRTMIHTIRNKQKPEKTNSAGHQVNEYPYRVFAEDGDED